MAHYLIVFLQERRLTMSKEEYPIINGVVITPGIIRLHHCWQVEGYLDTQIDALSEVIDYILSDNNAISSIETKDEAMKLIEMVRDLNSLINDIKATKIESE